MPFDAVAPTATILWVDRADNKEKRKLAKDFVNAHHSYIKWADRPSRKLYWLLWEGEKLVGVFGLGSCFCRPKPVMTYVAEHKLAFNEVANNIVYALHGYTTKNAGSRFLRLCREDAARWWKARYGDDLKAFQTFVLPPRTGAIYKADNWTKLGATSGGVTQTVRTLYGEEIEKHPEAERRVFKSGEVKYLLRGFTVTEPKLIFMRLTGWH